MTTTASEKKLHDLLADFGVAMLVTRTAEGRLRARPMAVAEVESTGIVWLLTQRNSPKMEELSQESHVNVTMQSSTKFVSLSGTASAVANRTKIEELWNESWKIWFPGGKDDPTLILLRIDCDTGEYWDNSGSSGLKYLIEAGKAYFSGTRPDVEDDPKIHAKVAL